MQLKKAVHHQNRLKFHAETVISEDDASPYLQDFLEGVKIQLPSDKYEVFKSLMRFPLPTTDIIDTIKDHYSKVFEAKDQFIDIRAGSEEEVIAFQTLLEELNEDNFWKNRALDAICEEPNIVLICDKPSTDEKGEYKPYFYALSIEKVIDVLANDENEIEYIIFNDNDANEKPYIAIIDDEYYHKAVKIKGEDEYSISSIPHNLGYTPARFLSAERLHNRTRVVQKSPLSAVLSRLDEYLTKYIGKNHLEMYAAFPIYWMYGIDEDGVITDDELREGLGDDLFNSYYERGTLETVRKNISSRNKLKNVIGAGTLMEVPAPLSKEEYDLREPMGIIPADIESLKYNAGEIDSLEEKIMNKATGKIEKASRMDRTNEAAVSSQFESERDVLIYVSSQLSKARTWLWDTLGKLYLGDKFKKSTYDYGTEFFIEDETQAIKNFESYKKAGASQTLMAHRANIFRQVATKNRPTMQLRLKILEAIEPYPLLDVQECINMFNQGIITGIDLDVKLRFTEYVNQFEREVGSITSFEEKNETYNAWINTVKTKIYSYGKAIERRDSTQASNTTASSSNTNQ